MKLLIKKILFDIGSWLASFLIPKQDAMFFFFFPYLHVGGAERVHADILKIASCQKPWIIITNKSQNSAYRKRFTHSGILLDISMLTNNCVLQAVATGFFVTVINRSRKALLFGSNSPFFYTLLPYIQEDVYCVDLIHAFGGGLETVSLPCVERINRRIVINEKTFEDLKNQYSLYNMAPEFAERISVVQNKVTVSAVPPQIVRNEKLRVLYVGRGTEEKRVHLVGKVGRFCHEKRLPVEFTLVGDVADAVDVRDRQYCRFTGELQCSERIEELYRSSDLLLVTSSREGFPMVIMEAMAHGVVPVATDVGGIHYHIRNGETGFLIANDDDESNIVCCFVTLIEQLHRDRALMDQVSEAAYEYAVTHFQGKKFDSYYRSLFMVHQS